MNDLGPGHKNLQASYRLRHDTVLVRLAENLREHIADLLNGEPRVDRISARAKSVSRFLSKAATETECGFKYSEPLYQIQDQVGARIVTFYASDVARIESKVNRYFTAIENLKLIPESEWEFGYFGHHMVLAMPKDVIETDTDSSMVPEFFELQIKTVFQHAWSEANHDLGYKPGGKGLTSDQKRRMAFTSAQAWGADRVFDQLFQERNEENQTKFVQ